MHFLFSGAARTTFMDNNWLPDTEGGPGPVRARPHPVITNAPGAGAAVPTDR